MLRIRKEQMDWFADKTRRAYMDQLVAYLEESHAARFARGEGTLRQRVTRFAEAAVAKADELGFSIQYDATQLVLMLLLLGLDAEEKHDFVRAVLRDRTLIPRGKVRTLVAEARERGIQGVDEVDLGEPRETT